MASKFQRYFGNYPAEYNRAIHGPYDPARFYGKADTPLSEVKVGELGAWLNRRNLHPLAMGQAIGRAYHRFLDKTARPKYASPIIYMFQLLAVTSTAFYFLNYPKNIRHHKQYKYHW